MRPLSSHARRWCLAAALLASPAAAYADVSQILAAARISPLQPAPAADFTLKDLAGAEQKLSDYAGRWVLLTFWATWCGPCKTEMPTLQKLHEERAADGFQVLAVSVDRSAGAPKKYVASKGYTFPVLHDAGGEVGRTYQASAVPVSYLVDPAGQLVGVSRGARDWSQLDATIDALLAERAVDPNAAPVYAAAAPVQLAPDVTPPTATATLGAAGPFAPGQPFVLDVAVQWAGTLQDYLLHPPTVQLPEGVRLTGTPASSSSTGGRQAVVYHLGLEASAPGTYALDPVELRYTPHGAEMMVTQLTGPTVEVVAPPSRLPTVAAAVGAAGVAGLGLWAAIVVGRRRRAAAAPVVDPLADLRAALERARERRVAGDVAGFLEAILPVLEALGQADEGLATALEQARYGGQPPSRSELDRLTRRAERALAEQGRGAAADPRDDTDFARPGGRA